MCPKPIRTHLSQSEKNFQSRLIQIGRKAIRLNPSKSETLNPNDSGQVLNHNKSKVGIIWIDLDWEFSLNNSDLGFIRIKNFFWIDSDWKSRIKSDSIGLNFD